MERRGCLVVLLLLLCGSLIPVRGFAIRKIRAATEPKGEERLHKRSYRTEDDFSTNRLADALDLIQAERLRLRENSYAPFEESPMQNLPYDEGYLEDDEEDVADDEPTAEDVRNFIASLLTNDDEPQLSSDTEIDDMLDDEVEQPLEENQLPAARSELEDILSPSDDEEEMEKKGVPNEVEGRPRKREYDPTFVVKKSDYTDAELSEEEIETLLQDIKDMEIEELAREEEEEEAEEDESVEATQPASVEEIEDILKDEDEEEEAENEAEQPDEEEEEEDADWPLNPSQEVDLTAQNNAADWPMYPADEIGINKEWLLDQYLKEQGPPSIKRKRSGPVFEEIEEEVDENDDDIGTAILAKYIAFEDEQNDYLVKALDLATKGQVEQTDKYIPEEVKYIQNAITDEQLLQAIQSLVETDEELAEDEAEAEEEEILNEVLPEEFPEEKRQAPPESELESLEGNPKSKVARAMAKALRKYFAAHPEDLKDLEADNEMFSDQSDSDGEWYDKPLPDEEEGSDESDWELNPFYRSLLEKYESSVAKRGYEDDEDELPYTEEEPEEENGYSPFLVEEESPLLPITEEDMCPAVGLTDGCAWSAKEGLAMDSEARNLCSRHQLCYTCGAAHGMSKDVCDRGFIGETDSACDGDIECRLEGVELYIAMSNNQIYVPTSLTHRFCDNPCTYGYITGTNDKKR